MTTAEKRSQEDRFLSIKEIHSTSRLATKLPQDIAMRYHAIPIAENDEGITVAISNPEDREVVQAIQTSLGEKVTIVRCSQQEIEKLIAHYYQSNSDAPIQILGWCPDESSESGNCTFVKKLAKDLNADLFWFETQEKGKDASTKFINLFKTMSPDLVVSSYPNLALFKKILLQTIEKPKPKHTASSVLSVVQPSWPLKRILLIIQNDRSDSFAMDWAIRLAKTTQAHLTILPLIPHVPNMYTSLQHDLPSLLRSSTPLGRDLRHLSRRLNDLEIQGTIKIRDEFPECQIRYEVEEEKYDMVIAGNQTHRSWKFIYDPDFLSHILTWVSLPTLIAQNRILPNSKEIK